MAYYSCLPSGLISLLSVWGGESEGPEPVCFGPRLAFAGRIVMIAWWKMVKPFLLLEKKLLCAVETVIERQTVCLVRNSATWTP